MPLIYDVEFPDYEFEERDFKTLAPEVKALTETPIVAETDIATYRATVNGRKRMLHFRVLNCYYKQQRGGGVRFLVLQTLVGENQIPRYFATAKPPHQLLSFSELRAQELELREVLGMVKQYNDKHGEVE